ncbi:MAG: cytochrome b/b6 domain-containing protein [Syntrophorhabdales bacterium]|jgi:thiosulfate reductase cytochrome b subunit
MKELHPLWLRIWHWLNTALALLLMVTGLRLRVPDLSIFGYRGAVLVHKGAGLVMAGCFLFWLVSGMVDGSIRRYYAPRGRDLAGLARQARYYAVGVFMGEKNPHPATVRDKFNPLQKLAYGAIQFVVTPVVIVTGILFSDILFFRSAIAAIGGIRSLNAIHLIGGYVFVEYLVVHVYMATLGETPLAHIREMVTGRMDLVEGPQTISPLADAPPGEKATAEGEGKEDGGDGPEDRKGPYASYPVK